MAIHLRLAFFLCVLCAFVVNGDRAVATEKFELADGDRVVLVGGTLIEREPEYGYWETLLTIRYPERNIIFRNLGWSGDTVFCDARAQFDQPAVGFRTLRDQLKTLKPTVIVVAYGSNESFEGEAGLPRFRQGLATLLDMLAETKARIVLLSPPRHEDLGGPLPKPTEHNRHLLVYRDALRQEAEKRHEPFLDLFELSPSLSSKSETDNTQKTVPRRFTDNGIHFNSYGYWHSGIMTANALAPAPEQWLVDLNADGQIRETKGAKLVNIQASPLRFDVTDTMLPAPLPPRASADRIPAPGRNRVLRIRGLPPGKYGLHIDGLSVAGGTADEWSAGMQLSRGPEFDQVEKLRQIIIEKNRLYFHRWRPQNETYLYGFRKKEQGQNAKEIPDFDRLIANLEAEIAKLRQPVVHQYELRLESREKE